ncbi:MAG: 4Fe-4S ferredoxin [Planctomycetota bacterium]|nr:MAG: 4Fe-4S ferredoxin [Planctomycetota bacterium]
MRRKIVKIDEEKCDGCGQCVPSCAEGAIQIVDGKARLVSEVYCDGLGACLGHCPQGAITIEEREADPFDEQAVEAHLKTTSGGGCPGSRPMTLPTLPVASAPTPPNDDASAPTNRQGVLRNWPIQLHLVPPNAPFFRDASVLLAANCAPFAVADFDERFLAGNVALTACPKLDTTAGYLEKLAAIMQFGGIRDLSVVRMTVPCCGGIVRLAEAARTEAGSRVPIRVVTVSPQGDVTEETV